VNPPTASSPLERRFGLLSATALNMANMVGIGPFITIPLLMSALNGPQAMLGWFVAVLITIPDGMVWSELGAAMPGSGGTFRYLLEGFGRARLGRLMSFLFIWQFILSGPLEIASGYIGLAKYLRYLWPEMSALGAGAVICGVGLLNILLLYRRVNSVAFITVCLWVGTLLTTGIVIVTGAMNFNPAIAFDFPAGGMDFSLGFLLGLGAATRVGVYDYLGYYNICYIGDEVRDPGKVIPRSITISILSVAAIYFAINLSIVGVVPWREFVPADQHPEADFVVSVFMERLHGRTAAALLTLLIAWTTLGSVFALLLGYSRIPYAAARDGFFFKVFARLHPRHHFPHVSLLVIGLLSIGFGFIPLGAVIDALIVTRVLVQFIGQIAALILLRRRQPALPRPFRVPAYPWPCVIALAGWLFIFVTTPPRLIVFGLGALAAGVVAFLLWSWKGGQWPFQNSADAGTELAPQPNRPE
jgi:amino acid transporter